MLKIEDGRDLGIRAIRREGELGQAVCADVEEISLAGQLLGDERRGGRVDQHADGDRLAEGNALALQLLLDVEQRAAGAAQLLGARHHRKRDGDIVVRRGAEQGAQLRAEKLRILKRKTNPAHAHRRVHLLGKAAHPAVVRRGADGQRTFTELLRERTIDPVLLVLRGEIRPVAVERLRTEQADALRAALEHERQVGRLPDLRKDFHGAPAARAGGQRPQLGEGFLPDIRPSLKCPVCLGGLLVRVNHNVSREAVGDDNAAVVETAV